jgi:hypothetical protein
MLRYLRAAFDPETDWTVVGSALLLLGWFGFLYLLLNLLAFSTTMPP